MDLLWFFILYFISLYFSQTYNFFTLLLLITYMNSIIVFLTLHELLGTGLTHLGVLIWTNPKALNVFPLAHAYLNLRFSHELLGIPKYYIFQIYCIFICMSQNDYVFPMIVQANRLDSWFHLIQLPWENILSI